MKTSYQIFISNELHIKSGQLIISDNKRFLWEHAMPILFLCCLPSSYNDIISATDEPSNLKLFISGPIFLKFHWVMLLDFPIVPANKLYLYLTVQKRTSASDTKYSSTQDMDIIIINQPHTSCQKEFPPTYHTHKGFQLWILRTKVWQSHIY